MTIRVPPPSWIGMRHLLVALLLTSGCSWMAVRSRNDPKIGCSRNVAYVDTGASLAGVVGIAALVTNLALDPPENGDHGNARLVTGWGVGALAITSLLYILSAGYGYSVNDRCEAERKRLYGPARAVTVTGGT